MSLFALLKFSYANIKQNLRFRYLCKTTVTRLFFEGVFLTSPFRNDEAAKEKLLNAMCPELIALLFAMVEATLRKHLSGDYNSTYMSRKDVLGSMSLPDSPF